MASPLRMNYSGKSVPAGVQSGAAPKVMKGARAAGEMYKKPGSPNSVKKASDKSSGQSNPTKGSAYDRTKYTQSKQPIAYSNEAGPRGTKFVC